MEGSGKQSRLLSRLLNKLRGEHRFNNLDKQSSFNSTGISDITICEKSGENDAMDVLISGVQSNVTISPPQAAASGTQIDPDQFADNIDLRYGGQYLTPEQLPEFCDQLHNLVQVIRNIQSYAKVTGEYPKALELRLQEEAAEVAALASEARNARDVVMRTRVQRRALRTQRKQLVSHLTTLKDAEFRELESVVRISDRKLFKSWEAVKDTTNSFDFEPLLAEVQSKQIVLDSIMRLIGNRRLAIMKKPVPPAALQPLPPPLPRDNNEDCTGTSAGTENRREGRRGTGGKRRRKEASREPRSVPLSEDISHNEAVPQVTLYIQNPENNRPRFRVNSAGAVALTSLDLPTMDTVRDILFFTSN